MDVYTPVGDVCQNRPLLVFAHGGAFVGGSKNNSLAESICESFAKRGYVAASINYRLATHNTVLGNDLFSLGGLTWFYDLENGIKVFRLSSELFPHKSNPKVEPIQKIIKRQFDSSAPGAAPRKTCFAPQIPTFTKSP